MGKNVHKETVEISIFFGWDAEPYLEKRMEVDVAHIVRFLKRLEETGTVKACYEAWCMGFVLYRALEAAGIECVVVAPGKLPRRVTDRIALEERLMSLDNRINEIAQSEPFREAVNRLRCLKGIDTLTARACVCEGGDFKRFPSAGSFMSFLGLVPREHSSGDTRRQGGITKAGNSLLRPFSR